MWGQLLSIGPILLSGTVGGYFLGNYLDQRFQTEPYLAILMVFFGVAGAIWSVYKILISNEGGSNKHNG